jgi:hypothetical protein
MPDKKINQPIAFLRTFYGLPYAFHKHPQPRGINATKKTEQVRELYSSERKSLYKHKFGCIIKGSPDLEQV